MRRIITIVVFLFASLASVSAQGAEDLLTKLANSLGERYAMHITVAMSDTASGDTNINGYFMVEGDAYYITLGVMEVYSDGKLRYEINNERKEVVEDRVNLEASDLLSNPTRAFTFVPKEFSSEVVSRADSRVVVRLMPKSEAVGIDYIELTLEESGSKVLPVAICYDYDGDKVSIALAMVDAADAKLPCWSKAAYRAYDIVSFL